LVVILSEAKNPFRLKTKDQEGFFAKLGAQNDSFPLFSTACEAGHYKAKAANYFSFDAEVFLVSFEGSDFGVGLRGLFGLLGFVGLFGFLRFFCLFRFFRLGGVSARGLAPVSVTYQPLPLNWIEGAVRTDSTLPPAVRAFFQFRAIQVFNLIGVAVCTSGSGIHRAAIRGSSCLVIRHLSYHARPNTHAIEWRRMLNYFQWLNSKKKIRALSVPKYVGRKASTKARCSGGVAFVAPGFGRGIVRSLRSKTDSLIPQSKGLKIRKVHRLPELLGLPTCRESCGNLISY